MRKIDNKNSSFPIMCGATILFINNMSDALNIDWIVEFIYLTIHPKISICHNYKECLYQQLHLRFFQQ